jgi:hypothetical protein
MHDRHPAMTFTRKSLLEAIVAARDRWFELTNTPVQQRKRISEPDHVGAELAMASEEAMAKIATWFHKHMKEITLEQVRDQLGLRTRR